jgi:L-lactate dehydrogenase complex protein LldG
LGGSSVNLGSDFGHEATVMSEAREAFFRRIRRAVAEGNRAGIPALPERGSLGYQGAGDDPVERFCRELAAAGGVAQQVRDADEAVAALQEQVRHRGARRVLLGLDLPIDRTALATQLRAQGVEVTLIEELPADGQRDTLFAADLGISGAAWLIAETGSIVTRATPRESRSLSLLPPVHLVVAQTRQILPDLFDLFEQEPAEQLPSCLTLITGPSKTGDVELKLVTGVHGPGVVQVILIRD